MDMETKGGDMEGMHHHDMKAKMMMWHSKSWSGWKSPVGLGFFLLTASLALAILLYTALNFVVSLTEIVHPADAQQAMTAQQQQEMEQEMQAQPTTGAAAQ